MAAEQTFDLYVSEFVVLDRDLKLAPQQLNSRFDDLLKSGKAKKMETFRATIALGGESEFLRMHEVTLLEKTIPHGDKVTRVTSKHTIGSALTISLEEVEGEKEIELFYQNNRLDAVIQEPTVGDIVIVEAKKKFKIAARKRTVLETNLSDKGTHLLIWMMPRKQRQSKSDVSE